MESFSNYFFQNHLVFVKILINIWVEYSDFYSDVSLSWCQTKLSESKKKSMLAIGQIIVMALLGLYCSLAQFNTINNFRNVGVPSECQHWTCCPNWCPRGPDMYLTVSEPHRAWKTILYFSLKTYCLVFDSFLIWLILIMKHGFWYTFFYYAITQQKSRLLGIIK